MDGDRRILYVQLENRAREFDARLLLSLKAASANFQVVMGPRWLFYTNRDLLPRGVYAFKTLNKIDAFEMPAIRQLGHLPIAWDEEGPGQIVPSIYLKGVNDEAVAQAGRIYAWGENQAKALAHKYPAAKNNVQSLGNPRWDLLRPEYRSFYAPEADAIKASHGRFILVNTNFSSYNAWHEDAFGEIAAIADEVGAFKKEDTSDQQMLKDIFTFEEEGFASYAAMLPALSAAFPEHTIIIRPHPTENHKRWEELAAPFANVKTVYEGTVVPWLLAAEAIIQNSCTTGVEALTLGRPVVAYCKTDNPLQEVHLANHVCPRVRSEQELIDSLRRFISDKASFSEHYAKGMRTLAKHISNVTGEMSTAAIVKSLGFFASKSEKQGIKFDRTFALPQGFRPYKITKYQRLKMPPIPAQDVADRVARLTKVAPEIGLVTISHIAESCFFFRR